MQTILVLDSQSPMPALKALEPLSVIVIPVRTPEKARHILTYSHPDVWICDLATPGLDPSAAIAEARARLPSLQVILTGPAACRATATHLINDGLANGFISKPWPLATIRQTVIHACEKVIAPASSQANMNVPAKLENTRYVLKSLLGDGGTGQVFHAHDVLLDMEVAIKVLHPELAEDQEALATLKSEARVAMQMSHRHIVRLYNLANRDDRLMLIMEFVSGQSLEALINSTGTLSLETVSLIARVSTEALHYAHRHGVLHNDLKPANMMLSDDGVLKLIDFGVATLIEQPRASEYVTGTPAYMSPEQLRGETLDVRTDIYALGIILYQLLTGSLPHPEHASVESIATHGTGPLDKAHGELRRVLERAVTFDRERRWPTAEAFGQAFGAACLAN